MFSQDFILLLDFFQVTEPLIADVAEVMKLAMDCIYACKRHDQLNVAFSVVECLPAKEEG